MSDSTAEGMDESQEEETMGEEEDEELEEGELPMLPVPLPPAQPLAQPITPEDPPIPEAVHEEEVKHAQTPTPTSPSPLLIQGSALTPASPIGAVSLVTSSHLMHPAQPITNHIIQLAPGHLPPPAPQVTPPKLTPHEISLITEAASKPGPNGTFQCTLCNKQFGYKNGLIRHIRLTHVGEKPYECNICHRRFGYKHILMEHQNLHYGHRPYACTQCDKKFAARSNLIQHRTVHKRPFVCNLCNKRFDKEEQLKKHLFAHPQALLSCTLCKYAAPNQSELNKHIMEAHAAVIQEGLRRNGAHVEGLVLHGAVQAMVQGAGHASPQGAGHTSPRGQHTDAAHLQRHTEPVTPPDGAGSPQDLSASSDNTPPSHIVRPQIPGHRIDAICSQLSTSVANVTPTTAAGICIKKEVDADIQQGLAKVQPMESGHHPPVGLVAAEIPRVSVAAQPIANTYVPISPTDSNDSKSSTLPGIQEMFSRRTPNASNAPLAFPNFPVTLPAHPDLQNILMSPPPASFNPSVSHAVAAFTQRPTAQLPPITQAPPPSGRKDQAMQHTAPITGFPSLEDVLAYYMGQGKLFKCQYCNILFFERGMFFLHASLHGTSSPWECSICHKICADKNEFTIHFVNQQHST